MNEHGIQNTIRNALAGKLMLFRANVGRGWTGKVEKIKRGGLVAVLAGDLVIRSPRPFDTGLPAGFSDTFGILPVVITQNMVGSTIGQFVAPEVKDEGENAKPHQAKFHAAVRRLGGRAGVVRSVADAHALLGLDQ